MKKIILLNGFCHDVERKNVDAEGSGTNAVRIGFDAKGITYKVDSKCPDGEGKGFKGSRKNVDADGICHEVDRKTHNARILLYDVRGNCFDVKEKWNPTSNLTLWNKYCINV